MLGVYGMKGGRFSELAKIGGQYRFYICESGHIVAPYGSVGLYWDYKWEDGEFRQNELYDPLRRRPRSERGQPLDDPAAADDFVAG